MKLLLLSGIQGACLALGVGLLASIAPDFSDLGGWAKFGITLAGTVSFLGALTIREAIRDTTEQAIQLANVKSEVAKFKDGQL